MRLAVSGGGTGGHVYPGLAVIAALEGPPFLLSRGAILYLGARGRAEEGLAQRAGLAFSPVTAGPVRGRGFLETLRSSLLLLLGVAQAWAALRRHRPAALLATGGYVSVPVVLAGWLRRLPTLLYLPDAQPGLAVRFLAPFATKIAVTAPGAALPAQKTVVTGYPVRPGFGKVDKATARARLGLDPEAKALLVWGGSQGARSLNREVSRHLQELLGLCQVVHLCGTADLPWLQALRQALPQEWRARYHLHGYLHEGVPEVMAAADLAVARAGASVLGEFPSSGLPAIVVPYPHAGGHQVHNARYLAEAGAALLLPEARLEELVPTVTGLLQDDARLRQMAEQARRLAQPEAAQRIAQLLVELAQKVSQAPEPHRPMRVP